MVLDGTPLCLDVRFRIPMVLERGVGVPPQEIAGSGRRRAFGDVPRSPWPSKGVVQDLERLYRLRPAVVACGRVSFQLERDNLWLISFHIIMEGAL
jgi:hypothetical protein